MAGPKLQKTILNKQAEQHRKSKCQNPCLRLDFLSPSLINSIEETQSCFGVVMS